MFFKPSPPHIPAKILKLLGSDLTLICSRKKNKDLLVRLYSRHPKLSKEGVVCLKGFISPDQSKVLQLCIIVIRE